MPGQSNKQSTNPEASTPSQKPHRGKTVTIALQEESASIR